MLPLGLVLVLRGPPHRRLSSWWLALLCGSALLLLGRGLWLGLWLGVPGALGRLLQAESLHPLLVLLRGGKVFGARLSASASSAGAAAQAVAHATGRAAGGPCRYKRRRWPSAFRVPASFSHFRVVLEGAAMVRHEPNPRRRRGG